MKPVTDLDLDLNNKEVGLFNLQLTIRKPICTNFFYGEMHSDIKVYIVTDPDGAFSST